MNQALPCPVETSHAPQAFCAALAELVQIGLKVARMVGRVAEAETALAEAAAQAGVDEGVSALASSLAEAIEADRAAAAAAESRQSVAVRTEAVAEAFARVSRGIRLTVLLAERLDRGWARRNAADDCPAEGRRMVRGAAETTDREAEGERGVRLPAALVERLESLDWEAGVGRRPAEEIIGEICRNLGLDPVRMAVRPPVGDCFSVADPGNFTRRTGDLPHWPPRHPDG